MNKHFFYLALRFILEMIGLFAIGLFGWQQGEGVMRFVFALAATVLAATLWGTFRVPGDPSSNGQAPVPVSGFLRLVIELAFFDLAAWSLFTVAPIIGWIYAIAMLIQYAISYDRVRWLLSGPRKG